MSGTRWAAVGCTHGQYIDPHFERVFLSWVSEYNPAIRIHLGDLWDFECLRGSATDKERAEGLAEDIDAGNRFLKAYFASGSLKLLLRGNHCERLWKMCSDANGVRREYAESVAHKLEDHVRQLGGHMLPYHVSRGVFRMGGLSFIHGISYALNCGQIHANTYCEPGGTIVFAHTHAATEGSTAHHPRPCHWLNIGCGRTLEPEYAERRINTLRWEHAWAYGEVFDDGSFTAHLYHPPQPPQKDHAPWQTMLPMSSPCLPTQSPQDQTAHQVL